VESEAAAAHSALEKIWALLLGQAPDARFERRGDLYFALFPAVPIPQCNGPWVVEDTDEAADALGGAIAEVDAAGAQPSVQTRSGHERTQRAAAELGLTERTVLPGMVMRPGELVSTSADGLAIDLIADEEIGTASDILATSFGAPREMFDVFSPVCAAVEESTWYVGRVDGEIVGTALGITVDGVTGVFNVATAAQHRGRGHGAALTARVVEDGFAGGAELAFLQSSEMGHGVYRRLGFRDVEEYVLLTRPALA
jgi:ribosomal protein S18 acetylase RimI-like enzyme